MHTQTQTLSLSYTNLTNKCDLVTGPVGQLIYYHHGCWFQPTDRFHSS